ncbi:MAG: bifunctional phosphopantothenoylcysteine decarboxylase/phosphopantothenate--cysteine ligase CoaBC [Anaerolineales bacterium]|jgi:phosphopantothenoylcysteine decarboxylase/phosphopantothenate--cysteine ligase
MKNSEIIPVLKDRRILLGVTGSIAAYKAVELASMLTKAGAQVDVILSAAARQFVTPLTFQSVTGRKVYGEADLWGEQAHVLHIGLGEAADLFIIAPATANTLAKLATGQADSLLTLTALAVRCPLLVAPAMDVGMYEQAATQENIELLSQRGVLFAGPAQGRMASGLIGKGRLIEPQELFGYVRKVLGADGSLASRKVVVTAGGTLEALDPVRVLANRSSGKQGFALAQAAVDRGASVTLISGPVHLPTPVGVTSVDVESAADMHAAVKEAADGADVLLMAAAVADYRPVDPSSAKLKRSGGVPKVVLEKTADILADIVEARTRSGHPAVIVGFAAESDDLLVNARAKLESKGVDLLVANDITAPDAGFEVDTNRVTLLDAGGAQELPLLSKAAVAEAVLERVVTILGTKEGKA